MRRISAFATLIFLIMGCISLSFADGIYFQGEGYVTPTEKSQTQLDPVLLSNQKLLKQPGDTITVNVVSGQFPNITLYTSVVDANGQPVTGLTQSDFSVMEQSSAESSATSETLTCFVQPDVSQTGISFALVFDLSGSMIGQRLEDAKAAAVSFLENCQEDDRGALVTFATGGMEQIVLATQPVSTDADNNGVRDIVDAVNNLKPALFGLTAVYDGTALGISSLEGEPSPKAVIVFSDGETNNDLSFDINEVISDAGASDVPIYTIGLGLDLENLSQMASQTGGRYYLAPTAQDMADIYDEILRSIRNQYTICYTSHNPALDGTTRTVTVSYDGNSGTGFYTVELSTENHVPSASAGADMNVFEGAEVNLDGSGSTDQDPGDTLSYSWTQTGGTIVTLSDPSAVSPTFTAPIADGTPLTFTLTVTDSGNFEASDSVTITVVDAGPAANFTYSPSNPAQGSAVQFSDQSTSPIDTISGWAWDFGGEGTSTDQNPAFTFQTSGDHVVALTVTDADGSTNTISQTVSVRACASGDCEGNGGCFVHDSGSGFNHVNLTWAALFILPLFGFFFLSRRKKSGKTGLLIGILALAMVIGSGKAFAENKEGKFTISPMIGGYIFDDDQDIDKDFAVGLGFGYNFTENLSAELMLDYGQYVYHYFNKTTCQCAEDDLNGYVPHLDALYHFRPDKQFVPYLAAGIGATILDFDSFDRETSAMANWGGGFKYFFTEDIALRGDVRHIITFDDSYNNVVAMVGLTIQLPMERKAAPTPAPKPAPVVKTTPKPAPVEKTTPKPKAAPIVTPPPEPEIPSVLTAGVRSVGKTDAVTGGNVLSDGGASLTERGICYSALPHPTKTDNVVTAPHAKLGKYESRLAGLTPGTTYYVRAYATNKVGTGYGGEKMFTTEEEPVAPPVVTKEPPKAAPKAVPPPVDDGLRIDLKILFDFDKSVVKPMYHNNIKYVADILKAHPGTDVVIEGHTCSIGTEAYNLGLSKRRANSVKRYLVEKFGIDGKRLKTVGYGESRPAFSNATREGRIKNRRVIVVKIIR